ncbi:MAG: hypothetical protein J0I11_07340 [Actinobacteria bacterium]|nr:hypothetical protein [Actinomycetota bacterium]
MTDTDGQVDAAVTMWNPRGGDPETVIRQALRAQAGGANRQPGGVGAVGPGSPRGGRVHLTTAQILLIVAIIGLLVGMAAGFTVLLLG